MRHIARRCAQVIRWLPGTLVFLAACGDEAMGPAPPPGPCATASARCAARLQIAPALFLRLFRSFPLDSANADLTAAVIVIHGTNRNPDSYFRTMVAAVRQAGRLDETLIVAPHFQTEDDFPAPDEPFWTSGGWKRGHLSVDGGPYPRVSSYAALDGLLAALADRSRFPELAEIVVTGHSAGGQVVHRFAAGGSGVAALAGIRVRYVVANPSTYLYLGPERLVGSSFGLPAGTACSDYNDWHYGLGNLNTYMSALDTAGIRVRLTERDVVILVGDADTGSAQLDQSCGANLQGPNRYLRGLILVDYMDAFHPGHRHRRVVVPGVGHSSLDAYTSPEGQGVLFGQR